MKPPAPLKFAGVLTCFLLISHAAWAQSDPLLETLIRKGILTEQEAKDIKAESAKDDPSRITWTWKNGLNFSTADGNTAKGKLGGRLQLDMAAFHESDELESFAPIGDIPAGLEFRRARIALETTFATSVPISYKVELDFAGSGVSFKDVFMEVEDLPGVGSLRLGHFKEPFSLEILESSRFLTFLERATPLEAFAPERNIGLMIGDAAPIAHATWAVGAFTDSDGSGPDVIDGNSRFTARLTALPWYDKDQGGRRLFHVGLAGSYIDPADETVRYRARPESHLAPRFVDTGSFAADHSYLLGAEAALVAGPFSVQAEYIRTWVDALGTSNPSFDGFYVYGSWFLTGEHRKYSLSKGTFDRLSPADNLSLSDGTWGAWELVGRYSHLDLNDAGFTGGRLQTLTGGINWYLNPNTRVMLNYVFADVNNRGGVDGDAHIIQSRFQVDF